MFARIVSSLLAIVFLALGAVEARCELKLAGVFGDHMVLQRDQEVPVWGWAEPGKEITVKLADQTASATADSGGRWMVRFAALSAGGPWKLAAFGDGEVTADDVLVGEVWLCSGQSNMAMTVSRAKDFDAERAAANFPQIRMFKVAGHATPKPQDDCRGQWDICSSETVGSFSATAYFFGRTLHQQLDVPIGLINSSWGGTDVAAWTSLPAQEAVPSILSKLKEYDRLIATWDPERAQQAYERALERWQEAAAAARKAERQVPRRPRPPADPAVNQNRPANLFNGMIQPLIPYAIRGATWYQGERNSRTVADGVLYGVQLKTLIRDWRRRWGARDFAFITVQLPNFQAPQQQPVETTGWVMVREAELRSLDLPNTGVAVTIDVGEANDIHPKNKQDVGHRLALWALGTVYEQDLVYSGPLLESHEAKFANEESDAGRVHLKFMHVGDGLEVRGDGPLTGFAVAGSDRKFHAARARITSADTVTLMSPEVARPQAVRYAWANNPNANLINSAGLPASPFRTDGWNVREEE